MKGITEHNEDYVRINIDKYNELFLLHQEVTSGKVCTVNSRYDSSILSYYTENEVIVNLTDRLNKATVKHGDEYSKLQEEIKTLKYYITNLKSECEFKEKEHKDYLYSLRVKKHEEQLDASNKHAKEIEGIKQMNIFKFLKWKRK